MDSIASSPYGNRVLSEQSENTLDSDSRLSLSVQSKLLQSPSNSFENNKGNDSAGRNNNNHEESKSDDQEGEQKQPAKAKNQEIYAGQDMFSEHFDVS